MQFDRPELNQLRIGYLPLTDCLPLIMAKGLGLFEEQGVSVTLSQEASWATIRDKLVVGHLDAAHMLAPMVLASSLGLGGLKKGLLSAFTLNLNGNAITLSNALCETLGVAAHDPQLAWALADHIRTRERLEREPLVFAVVFPFSSHNYFLRDWLARADIDPDRDVKIVVLPPLQMVDNLRLQHIDGFCVGEPWNSVAIAQDLGQCVALSCQYWPHQMEKVFTVTQTWAAQYPATHAALLRALYKACTWLEVHRSETVELVNGNALLPLDHAALAPGLTGLFQCSRHAPAVSIPDLLVFHRDHANRPNPQQARELLTHMQRWRQLEATSELSDQAAWALVNACFRPDLYAEQCG